MGEDHGVMGGQGLKLIGGAGKGQAGQARNFCRHGVRKADGRGKACPHGGAALGQFH